LNSIKDWLRNVWNHNNAAWQYRKKGGGYIEGGWHYCEEHRTISISILIFLTILYLYFSPGIRALYSGLVHPGLKEVRINLVTNRLTCNVASLKNSCELKYVDSVILTNFSLGLTGTKVSLNNLGYKDLKACFQHPNEILLAPAKNKQETNHTLMLKKGELCVNLEVSNSKIEFEKNQNFLSLYLKKGETKRAKIFFEKSDVITGRSNGEFVCDSNTITQEEDWHFFLTNRGEMHFIDILPHNENQEFHIGFAKGALQENKNVFADSALFPFEITNISFSDAKGNLSVGKAHFRIEEYDIVEIRNLAGTEEKFKVDGFKYGREGISVKASGKASSVSINGEEVNKSRMSVFLEDTKIQASLLIIFSGIVGYFLRRFFERR
jgi:hypothetical protein